jgi:putative acetyltransferase
MSLIRLRRARASDAEGLARLMSAPEIFGGVLQMPYADAERWRSRLGAAQVEGRADLHLVAEVDGDLAGSAGLHSPGPSPRRRHVMALGLAVAKDRQRQGVGRALLGALCDYADDWAGVLRIELTVYTDNARAIELYRRFGFEVEGIHRAYALRDGLFVDAHAMARLHPNPPLLPATHALIGVPAAVVADPAADEPWPREDEA